MRQLLRLVYVSLFSICPCDVSFENLRYLCAFTKVHEENGSENGSIQKLICKVIPNKNKKSSGVFEEKRKSLKRRSNPFMSKNKEVSQLTESTKHEIASRQLPLLKILNFQNYY